MAHEGKLLRSHGVGLYFGRFAQSTALAFLAWAILPRRAILIPNHDYWGCQRQKIISPKYGDNGKKRKNGEPIRESHGWEAAFSESARRISL